MHEIAAISGHKSLKEIERYTKAADQERLARMAMDKTMGGEQTEAESVKRDRPGVSKPLASLAKKAG